MSAVVGIDVPEAARVLGLSQQRVRALIASELLNGRKVGGRWFIDPESIERWGAQARADGRPFSDENAWAILIAASGKEPSWLSPWDRSRLRSRLSRNWNEWIPKVRRRASVHQYRAHPSQLKMLSSYPDLILGGVSAARHYKVDLYAREQAEGYIHRNDLNKLVSRFKLSKSSNPNVLLHLVESSWPLGPEESSFMPPAVVAVDLVESPDSRSRRAGRDLLRRLRNQHGDSD